MACLCILFLVTATGPTRVQLPGPPLPYVQRSSAQPLLAQVQRIREALDYLGSPLPARTKAALNQAARETDESRLVKSVQDALDSYCLLGVNINPESRVKVAQGPAKPILVEQGWRIFLVKVQNDAGVTSELKAVSPNAQSLFNSPKEDVRGRWLDMQMFNS